MSSKKQPPDRNVLFSTTEGRARFPDFLQMSFGDKAVIGFDRYGRVIGAIVPMEAVQMLAGETVDADVSARIRRAAQTLVREAPGNAAPIPMSEVRAAREERRLPAARRKRRA